MTAALGSMPRLAAGTLAALLSDYTFRTVALGAAIIGLMSGVVGCFSVLRREALLADGASHAALPGVVAAYLITGSKDAAVLLAGAAASAVLAAAATVLTARRTRIKFESALAVAMSVFFGLGLALMSYAQRLPGASKAGLARFIYGEASSIVMRDVCASAALALMLTALVCVFFRQFKLAAFDPEYAASAGLRSGAAGGALTAMTVAVTVLGIQAVGAVLMSALLIAPAVAARQWTRSLAGMTALAAVFGAVSGVAGTAYSSLRDGVPTGPAIVVTASVIAGVSLLAAPGRGIAAKLVRRRRLRRRVLAANVSAPEGFDRTPPDASTTTEQSARPAAPPDGEGSPNAPQNERIIPAAPPDGEKHAAASAPDEDGKGGGSDAGGA